MLPNAAVKSCSNCLVYAPDMAFHYGNTPYMESLAQPYPEFLAALSKSDQIY